MADKTYRTPCCGKRVSLPDTADGHQRHRKCSNCGKGWSVYPHEKDIEWVHYADTGVKEQTVFVAKDTGKEINPRGPNAPTVVTTRKSSTKVVSERYTEVMEQHAERMRRLTNQRGIARMKKLYDAAHAATQAKLKALTAAGRKDTFTAYQHHFVLAQLKVSQANLTRALQPELKDVTKEAQVEAVHAFAQDTRSLEKDFTGAEVPIAVDETAQLNRLVQLRRPELDLMHQKALTKWGGSVFEKMNGSLIQSMAQGLTTDEAIDALPGAAEREWWQGERIVRTETAWAYNAATHDSLKAAQEELPDMRMRWTELIDDDSGEPLDDRVSADSMAMHGQVAFPGQPFTMPSAPPAHLAALGVTPEVWHKRFSSMFGRSWLFPPNRPNDRSRLLPWRPHWGIPGWELVAGRRRDL